MNITTEMALKAVLHNQDIYIKRLEEELEEVKAISTKHVKALNRKRDKYRDLDNTIKRLKEDIKHKSNYNTYLNSEFNKLKDFNQKLINGLILMYFKSKRKYNHILKITAAYNTSRIWGHLDYDTGTEYFDIKLEELYEFMENPITSYFVKEDQ